MYGACHWCFFYPQIEDLGKKINNEQTINSDKQNTKTTLYRKTI